MHVALVDEIDLNLSRVGTNGQLGWLVERVDRIILATFLWRILLFRRLARLMLLMRSSDHDPASKRISLHELKEHHHLLVANVILELLPVLVPMQLFVEEHAIVVFHEVQRLFRAFRRRGLEAVILKKCR